MGLYRNEQGGFACLKAQLTGSGRRRRSRTLQRRRQSRGLSGEKEGEETINKRQTNAAQCMTWRYAVLEVT